MAAPLLLTSRSRARRFVIGVCSATVLVGLVVEVWGEHARLDDDRGAVPVFSLSYEANVPTALSAGLLFVAAILLAVRARVASRDAQPYAARWWLLAAGFAMMSVDEIAQFHEHAGVLRLDGLLYFSWVVPAAVLLGVLGFSYLPLLRSLPRRTRLRFAVAGATYVGGAVLLELPLGYWTERHGPDNLGYALIDWVEETMEIAGSMAFVFALVDHLGELGVTLQFGQPADVETRS